MSENEESNQESKRETNKWKEYYKIFITEEHKMEAMETYDVWRKEGKKFVGTCNVDYEPKENEVVIYYGSYCDDYLALPQSNKIYIHVLFFGEIKLDRFECDRCWDKIDKIFIMNLEKEIIRFNDTMLQLCTMNAPLDRVHHFKTQKVKNPDDIYTDVTKTHLDCIKIMMEKEYETCLFLEDDIQFTSNIKENKSKLFHFLNRKYDYNIVFLAASRYGCREDYDDLLILDRQCCTTSSAYLLDKKTAPLVYNTILEGYDELLKGGPHWIYCIDRYWCKLDKKYIFKNKLCYQKLSVSNITGELNKNLD
jgi:hypothetical protein